jgi:hypothetical protein
MGTKESFSPGEVLGAGDERKRKAERNKAGKTRGFCSSLYLSTIALH